MFFETLFLPEFSSNQHKIWKRYYQSSRVLCYDFSKPSNMFFRIYPGFTGSLYGSMSNFDRLFLLGFFFKPWLNDSYVLKFSAMTFLRIHSCSSGFIQDFLDHYVDQCRLNDVHVNDQSIGSLCQSFEHMLHLIIEIHTSNNVSCGASIPDNGPALGL